MGTKGQTKTNSPQSEPGGQNATSLSTISANSSELFDQSCWSSCFSMSLGQPMSKALWQSFSHMIKSDRHPRSRNSSSQVACSGTERRLVVGFSVAESRNFRKRNPWECPRAKKYKITKRTHLSFQSSHCPSTAYVIPNRPAPKKRTHFSPSSPLNQIALFQPIPTLARRCPRAKLEPHSAAALELGTWNLELGRWTADLKSCPNSRITCACWPRFVRLPSTASRRIRLRSR